MRWRFLHLHSYFFLSGSFQRRQKTSSYNSPKKVKGANWWPSGMLGIMYGRVLQKYSRFINHVYGTIYSASKKICRFFIVNLMFLISVCFCSYFKKKSYRVNVIYFNLRMIVIRQTKFLSWSEKKAAESQGIKNKHRWVRNAVAPGTNSQHRWVTV